MHCKNCTLIISGNYCSNCGQKAKDYENRSLARLIGELLNGLYYLDNRLIRTFRYLIFRPGVATVEFLEGKRMKFVSPISFFLFINIIFFLVSPVTDYSTTLKSQMNYQPYSSHVKEIINTKLQKEERSLDEYRSDYDKKMQSISKLLIVINVPIIALILYSLVFYKRRFFYDAVIFSFHFFSLLLIFFCLGHFLKIATNHFLNDEWINYVWYITGLLIPMVYLYFSLKRFTELHWVFIVPISLVFVIMFIISNFLYRYITFHIILWMT